MPSYEKEEIDDGWKIVAYSSNMTDADWFAVSDLLDKGEKPVREFVLHLPYDPFLNSDSTPVTAGQGFNQTMRAIASNKTLLNFELNVHIVPDGDVFLPTALQALKENTSIKQLHFVCTLMQKLDAVTASALIATVQNNRTVRSFSMDAFSSYFTVRCVSELMQAIATSNVDRLKIEGAEEDGFQLLMQTLPAQIVHLDVGGCRILDDDASPAALQSFIHSNRTLKELILPWLIAPKAAEMDMGDNPLKIVEAYTVSGTLLSKERTLFFNGTDVKDGEEDLMITELTKPDSTWRTLHIEQFGSGMLDCITEVLSRPNSLTKIIIDQDTFDEDDDQIALYRALSQNSSVKKVHLNFQINPQTLDLLASIGANASINMHLSLKCTNRNEILSASKITGEEALDLARALSTVTKIRELELTLPYIDDSAFQALVKGLPTSLTSLDVEDNSISKKSLPVILDFLKTHTALKKLSLTNNGITVKEEQAHNLLQTIHQVADANNCLCNIPINERVEEALAKDEEKINLFNAYLRDDHVCILCTELMKNPNRSRSIDLRGNGRITEVGYQYLADVLPKVSISVLLAGINNMTEPQQIVLFNGLAKNKTIKELDLDENKIGQQAVPILMQIIQNNPALESIDVSQCSLDNDAAVNIASFWKNTHLKKMKATFNYMMDRGFASLLQSRPPTLVALDLSFNAIGEESLPVLLQFLTSLPIQTPVDGLDWDAATELAKKNGVFELRV